ncbi:MAG: hypothetical protein IJ338_04820 [Bacteroidaceae bacterium]|nr:hypothetical protein [Bacteroidaceae bacterium]
MKIIKCLFVFSILIPTIYAQEQIKLGTHNSLTYLPPQWYFRWLNFTSKCQNLTIEEQYDFGVRYFDFRIKFTRKGKVRAGHGIMTYKADFDSIYNFLNKKGDCYINIVLENFPWQKDKKDSLFVRYVKEIIQKYPQIRFVGGEKKRPWTQLIPLGNTGVKACFEFYERDKKKFPRPRYYARKKNEQYWKEVDTVAFSLFDFIELNSNKEISTRKK